MTKDDLIRMADLAGYDVDDDDDVYAPAEGRYGLDPRLEHFAQLVSELVRQDEREQWDTSDMAHRSGGLSVEQAEKQEPDFWIGYNPSEGGQFLIDADKPSNEQIALYEFEPVYTVPTKREWVGLTDEEMTKIASKTLTFKQFVEIIEAKLKERNI
jgi:hypothetical protein